VTRCSVAPADGAMPRGLHCVRTAGTISETRRYTYSGKALLMKAPIFSIIALLSVAACSTPKSFMASGVHDDQKYKIEVARGEEVINPSLLVYLNDERAMAVDRGNFGSDPNCERKGAYSWKCAYSGKYDGMTLRVVENRNAAPYNTSLTYDIYLDDEYLQTVTGSML